MLANFFINIYILIKWINHKLIIRRKYKYNYWIQTKHQKIRKTKQKRQESIIRSEKYPCIHQTILRGKQTNKKIRGIEIRNNIRLVPKIQNLLLTNKLNHSLGGVGSQQQQWHFARTRRCAKKVKGAPDGRK